MMTLGSKVLKKYFDVDKKSDVVFSDLFLSFVYMMFVVFYDRRSQGAAGKLQHALCVLCVYSDVGTAAGAS